MIGLTQQLLQNKFGEERVMCIKQPTDMSRKTKLFLDMYYFLVAICSLFLPLKIILLS